MKHARIAIALSLLAGMALVTTGCVDAAAEEPAKAAKGYEHGVFEFTILRGVRGDDELARWTTSAEEMDSPSIQELAHRLKVAGGVATSSRLRVRILDRLSEQGWELITRSDVAVAAAAGTGIGERYVLRRKR
jgi:hypothetical protein